MFLSWPLWGRAALVLGSVLLVLLLVRVPLLKLLSLIPFSLKWIFRAVYLLLELLISLLHKLLGGMFYRVDNALASFGGRVDGWSAGTGRGTSPTPGIHTAPWWR